MLDLSAKRNFFLDLDDTLIDTENANRIGFKRAYQKLENECKESISSKLSYAQFEREMNEEYHAGEGHYDFEPEVFEKVCKGVSLKYKINPGRSGDSLSAMLYWTFKQAKDNSMVRFEHSRELIHFLRSGKGCSTYLLTKGRCHYQHTKMFITNLDEGEFDGLYVVDKEKKETKAGKILEVLSNRQFEPDRCLMIGDNVSDVAAGHEAGIDAIRIMTGSHSTEKAKGREQTPEAEFANLGDLLEKFKESGFK